MPVNLIPLPTRRAAPLPDNMPPEVQAWIEGFTHHYEQAYAILQQNVDRLSRLVIPEAPGDAPPLVGHGIGWDSLRDIPWNMVTARFALGLQQADGSSNNKANISYTYLGVGDVVLGDGTTTTLTADITTNGANGLDTGSEAANTWYALHVITSDEGFPARTDTGNALQPPNIRRSAPRAALLSLSATAPLLPPGYNRFRRVGWVRNNGLSNLYRIINAVDDDWVWWNEAIASGDFLVLNVTTSAVTYTDVSAAAVAPSTCREAFIGLRVADGAGIDAVILVKNKDLSNEAAAGVNSHGAVAATTLGVVDWRSATRVGLDSSQVFQYRTAATTNDALVCVKAYRDIR